MPILSVLLAAATVASPAPAHTGVVSEPGIRHAPVVRLVTFGHSWVAGRYPDPAITPWPDRVAASHGVSLANAGVGATEASQTLDAVLAYQPRAADEVVIEAMLNDVRKYGDAGIPAFKRTVRSMLRHLTMAPVRPARIVMVSDAPITLWQTPPGSLYDQGSDPELHAYADALEAVASKFARFNVRILDLSRRWAADEYIASDGIHPSEAGTARIAQRVAWALGSLGRRR
ncbi:MAG: SGNH/GDSL hydrolase family protein [Solirubrobacteraceae bacterium]